MFTSMNLDSTESKAHNKEKRRTKLTVISSDSVMSDTL